MCVLPCSVRQPSFSTFTRELEFQRPQGQADFRRTEECHGARLIFVEQKIVMEWDRQHTSEQGNRIVK